MNELIRQALSTFVIGAFALGALLFLPAWTFDYWQAAVFIAVFMMSVTGIGLYLALEDPALLERRKELVRRRNSRRRKESLFLLGSWYFSACSFSVPLLTALQVVSRASPCFTGR
jgi:MFS superfamily sulfate permease-like transporter